MSDFFARLIELFGRPEFSLIEAHQASTHLSIGLLLGGALFDFLAAVVRKAALRETAFRVQIAGTVLLAATFALGYYGNPLAGKQNELGQKAELHFYAACLTVAVFGVLALWRALRQRHMAGVETVAYTILTMAGIAVVVVTGWMGGHVMG